MEVEEEPQRDEIGRETFAPMEEIRSRKRKRKFQTNQKTCAMRLARVRKRSDAQTEGNADPVEVPIINDQRITCSSLDFKKVESLFQPCTVNLGLLTEALQRCQACKQGPLALTDVNCEVEFDGSCPIIRIPCKKCSKINLIRSNNVHRIGKRGPPGHDANTKAALGALDAGIGHTHYASLLSTMGLPALSEKTFKKREREAGNAVESVAKRTCRRYAQDEKELTKQDNGKAVESEEVDIAVSYDMSWRKRGKSFDSSSGMGSVIGLNTKKVISYGVRNQDCRTCKNSESCQKSPKAHDCRRNHTGSSKSMESSVAVQLFNEAPLQGMRFSTYVGDEDSTTESRLKALVEYEIEKWTDVNHARRTLGSRLYSLKGTVKGLNSTVIIYISRNVLDTL